MAIVVERTTAKATTNSGNAVAAFSGTPTVGNRIIALGHTWNGGADPGAPTISDQDSNVYTIHRFDVAGSQGRSSSASAPITATRANLQVTWAHADANTFAAMEVSGLAASPVDVTTGTNADTTSPYEQATGTLAQADELVCSNWQLIGTTDQNENIALTTWGGLSPSTLWINNGPGIVGEFGAAGYKIVSSTASVLTGFVADLGNSSSISVVTYKAAETWVPEQNSPKTLHFGRSAMRW